ncbi:hypothetical protein M409DRAFT_66100 [Zasmidium cellare ATCC 36951]|uniref:NADH:flavin oxidoreductase/NADH oxidase N-terminal domain-containing protein n=1 Tax=Zasmidium cellare ATCC 36951 TaxID=1080233 RepID=A0A6A6CQ75_ZASCE|nr:uncharacterized protein M409DRAFT_66100 [Zasmidium cellare ATCC 36951]KAF2167616.1 hypothetical protein M409DRAFT_66100 [Zasmidium cellare ATCC 36951]
MASAEQHSALFKPLRIGSSHLSHRIALAPLTRRRAQDDHTHTVNLASEYYAQPGVYNNIPGIYTHRHIEAWKQIVDKVHEAGGIIFLQLAAVGRLVDLEDWESQGRPELFSASAIPVDEDYPVPTPLDGESIEQYIEDFATAAKAGVEIAGFDGVEIHGANGLLVDQFIQDGTNQRSDSAVANAVGADKTAIRLSPFSPFRGMGMKDPLPQFLDLLTRLKPLKLAYIHLIEPRIAGSLEVDTHDTLEPLMKHWSNTSPVVLASGYTPSSALEAAQAFQQYDIIIAFGRHFTANPGLVYRIKNTIELNQYDRSTFYSTMSPRGYIDYAFSKEWQAAPKEL